MAAEAHRGVLADRARAQRSCADHLVEELPAAPLKRVADEGDTEWSVPFELSASEGLASLAPSCTNWMVRLSGDTAFCNA